MSGEKKEYCWESSSIDLEMISCCVDQIESFGGILVEISDANVRGGKSRV
jgi:hypothetical protein